MRYKDYITLISLSVLLFMPVLFSSNFADNYYGVDRTYFIVLGNLENFTLFERNFYLNEAKYYFLHGLFNYLLVYLIVKLLPWDSITLFSAFDCSSVGLCFPVIRKSSLLYGALLSSYPTLSYPSLFRSV